MQEYRSMHKQHTRGQLPHNKLLYPESLRYLSLWVLGKHQLHPELPTVHIATVLVDAFGVWLVAVFYHRGKLQALSVLTELLSLMTTLHSSFVYTSLAPYRPRRVQLTKQHVLAPMHMPFVQAMSPSLHQQGRYTCVSIATTLHRHCTSHHSRYTSPHSHYLVEAAQGQSGADTAALLLQ